MGRSHGDNTHAKPGFDRCGMSILRLQGEKVFAAQGFFVRLLGICKTSVTTGEDQMRKTHECSAVFLHVQREIYSQPKTLQDGFHHGFQIRFPDNPTAKHRFPDTETLNRLLEVPQRQHLPPSGDYGPGNEIRYKIQLVIPGQDPNRQIKSEQDITFSQTRDTAVTSLDTVKLVQLKAVPADTGPNDWRNLSVNVECARELVQCQPFALNIVLAEAQEHSFAKFLLKSCTLQLIEYTAIQGDSDLKTQRRDEYVLASCDFERQILAITRQPTDLGALLQNPTISLDHAPSFSCKNIQRTYDINVLLRLEVEHSGIQEFCFCSDSVHLLPAEDADTAWKQEEEKSAMDDLDFPRYWHRFAGMRNRGTPRSSG